MTTLPPSCIRDYGAAFLTATLAALVVDAVLQLALDAVAVSAYGGGAPWWITANLPGARAVGGAGGARVVARALRDIAG